MVSPSMGQRRGPATKVRAERLAFLGLFLLPGPQLFPGTMKLPKTQLCSVCTFSVSGLLPLRDLRSRVPLPPQLPSPQSSVSPTPQDYLGLLWVLCLLAAAPAQPPTERPA